MEGSKDCPLEGIFNNPADGNKPMCSKRLASQPEGKGHYPQGENQAEKKQSNAAAASLNTTDYNIEQIEQNEICAVCGVLNPGEVPKDSSSLCSDDLDNEASSDFMAAQEMGQFSSDDHANAGLPAEGDSSGTSTDTDDSEVSDLDSDDSAYEPIEYGPQGDNSGDTSEDSDGSADSEISEESSTSAESNEVLGDDNADTDSENDTDHDSGSDDENNSDNNNGNDNDNNDNDKGPDADTDSDTDNDNDDDKTCKEEDSEDLNDEAYISYTSSSNETSKELDEQENGAYQQNQEPVKQKNEIDKTALNLEHSGGSGDHQSNTNNTAQHPTDTYTHSEVDLVDETTESISLFDIDSNKHPLQHKWTLWYKDFVAGKSLADMQHEVMSFQTVEDFWSLYRHLLAPSKIKQGNDFSLFKNDIVPLWDPEGINNRGCWIITQGNMRPKQMDNIWLDVMLAMMGAELDDSEMISGAVIQVRRKTRIIVWTEVGTDVDLVSDFENRFRSLLHLPSRRIKYHQNRA